MPKFLNFLFTFLTLLVFASSVFASGFQLTRIGNMDVTGQLLNEWWYTGTNPSLTGIAIPNTAVDVSIDGVSGTAQADASGNWTYNPTTLTSDNAVLITSSGSTISFTLHAGQALPENIGGVGGEAPSQPVAGITFPTIALFLGGILGLYSGIRLIRAKRTIQ